MLKELLVNLQNEDNNNLSLTPLLNQKQNILKINYPEDPDQCFNRFSNIFKEILTKFEEKDTNIIIVTHAIGVSSILNKLDNNVISSAKDVKYCSISSFETESKKISLRAFNAHTYDV